MQTAERNPCNAAYTLPDEIASVMGTLISRTPIIAEHLRSGTQDVTANPINGERRITMRTQFRYNAPYGDYPTITKFAFSYNDGKGTMSLNLEIFFERAVETKSKSFRAR